MSIKSLLSKNTNKLLELSRRFSFISANLIGDDRFFGPDRFDNVEERKEILENIRKRNCCEDFESLFEENLSQDDLKDELLKNARRLPNNFHPIWYNTLSFNFVSYKIKLILC